MIGKVLDGRYRIVRQLGAGGFAKTYLAQDTRIPLEPFCVVKHLHPQTNDAEQLKIATRLFNSEAEGLAKLGAHPQIPQLLAYFCQEGEFYLVEEFVEGHPLSAEMHKIWRSDAVEVLLIDVLKILDFIHQNGVIHRDVKPGIL
jgi:Serine/threonine protein kinase